MDGNFKKLLDDFMEENEELLRRLAKHEEEERCLSIPEEPSTSSTPVTPDS